MIVRVMHKFRRKSCLDHAKWYGAALICSVCKTPIAIRYGVEGKVKVYVYKEYQRYKSKIQDREDTHEASGKGDLLGQIVFTDWDSFLDDLKLREDYLHTVQGDGGRVRDSHESSDSIEF